MLQRPPHGWFSGIRELVKFFVCPFPHRERVAIKVADESSMQFGIGTGHGAKILSHERDGLRRRSPQADHGTISFRRIIAQIGPELVQPLRRQLDYLAFPSAWASRQVPNQ